MHHILNTGRKYGRIALRLLYPVRCPFCDEIVPGFEKLICDTCREEAYADKRLLHEVRKACRAGRRILQQLQGNIT